MPTKKKAQKIIPTIPVDAPAGEYTMEATPKVAGDQSYAVTVPTDAAKIETEKLNRQRHAKEILWKVTKSVMIAGSAALITFILQQLELKMAQDHPEATQAVLSVVVAMLKAVVSALTKL